MPDISARLEVIRSNPYGESVKTAVRDALSILAESRGGDVVEELPHGVVNDSQDGLYGVYEAGTIQPSSQLFDKYAEQPQWTQNGASVTIIPTGVRAVVDGTRERNAYCSIILPNTNYLLGKTLTVSAIITPSSLNNGAIRFFWFNGSYAAQSIYQLTDQDGYVSGTFSVPDELPSGMTALLILFSGNHNQTGVAGDYVDYENVMLNVGTEALPYEPYHGIPDA